MSLGQCLLELVLVLQDNLEKLPGPTILLLLSVCVSVRRAVYVPSALVDYSIQSASVLPCDVFALRRKNPVTRSARRASVHTRTRSTVILPKHFVSRPIHHPAFRFLASVLFQVAYLFPSLLTSCIPNSFKMFS